MNYPQKHKDEEKRVFFGCGITSPWPSHYPKADIIDSASRHLTLAFLGNIPYPQLLLNLSDFPHPPFKIGPVGFFDHALFLPEHHPRLVAWHMQYYELAEDINRYLQQIRDWLINHDYNVDERPFLSHITIARRPHNIKEWKKAFVPLPAMLEGIHLYESVGQLHYQPLWSLPLLPPFEEKEHTADVAFLVRAESMRSLHLHAQIALAFKCPLLLKYIPNIHLQDNLDNIIMSLNQLISQADSEEGCSLKAVSFHGEVMEKDGIFEWEMIADV
jgi:RNA 2',3'-cyclic 3'-phosphodiesterase